MATAVGCGHPLKTGHRADAGVGGADGASASAGGSIGTSVAGTSGSSAADAAAVADAYYGEPDVPVGGTADGAGGTTSAGGSSDGTGADGSDDDSTGTDSTGCPVAPEMISDFESGQGDMIPQGSPRRSGWWYVYYPGSPGAMVAGKTQTPAFNPSGPIAVEPAPDASPCNKYALHSTGSGFAPGTGPGFDGLPDDGVGFGAGFSPRAPASQVFNSYDVSRYTGIRFKMKAGSGIQQAVYFEMLAQETLSSSQGGLLGAEGNYSDIAVGLHNNRGQLLNPPWTPNAISSSYQTFAVPFGTLVPRWVPLTSAGPYHSVCLASGTPKCQAPAFNPAHVLAFQVSIYQDEGFPKPAGSTPGTYDLWIDDIEFMTDDSGLQTRPGFPLANPGGVGSCLRPQGPSADAKFLVSAYNQWKSTFVSGNKVIRPDHQNDTISEGIAYGMLIAVNMNDQDLFDGLYGFWKDHPASTTSLMTWCVPGSRPDGGGAGTACLASGGSATGADEDAAYALLMADKAWGGTYKADALTMINDIWANDIDSAGTKLPKGGSGFGSPANAVTSPSYFAPATYRAFAAVDGAHDWAGVITAVYGVIGGTIAGSNGLIPAWCSATCTAPGSNGWPTDPDYQYDSHRLPMRIGLDYCFNAAAEAKAYTKKTTAYFALMAQNGIGFLVDMFTPSGGAVSGSGTNSASMLGTAAVSAMASGNQTFLNDAYQAVFDILTRGTMAPSIDVGGGYGESGSRSPQPTYGYYNATVGMLTLLIMTGNFMH